MGPQSFDRGKGAPVTPGLAMAASANREQPGCPNPKIFGINCHPTHNLLSNRSLDRASGAQDSQVTPPLASHFASNALLRRTYLVVNTG